MTSHIPRTYNPVAPDTTFTIEQRLWMTEREWDATLQIATSQADKLQRVQDVIDEYKHTSKVMGDRWVGIIRKLEEAIA
jgi:hypothetical protein